MSDTSIKVGIVGLGNIGFGYDRDSPRSHARTHASAAEVHPAVDLVWGVDHSPEAREGFRSRHSVQTFETADEAFDENAADIVVLAVGLAQRNDLWPAVIESKPLVVICEKPLAATAAKSNEIAAACAGAGIDLVVNFPRRYSSQTLRAKQLIDSGRIGEFRSGHVWYGKGIANSGSHFINLLLFLFGSGWTVDQVEISDSEYLDGDSDASFRMSRGTCAITFTPLDVKTFEFAEIDLLFESGRLRFVNHAHSLVEQIGLSSAGFDGMSQLVDEVLIADESVLDYQLNVLNFVVDQIGSANGFRSDVRDAISTAEVVDRVFDGLEQK